MEIPESMKAELAAWNNGKGINLASWAGCEGNFKLAVGYASIFWPKFVEFEGYIFVEGFSEDSLRRLESQQGSTPKSVEWVMNHLHIADLQHYGCADIAKDKLLIIGNALKEIYELKLRALFPENPCTVEFYVPEHEDDLLEYQISFWQIKHEAENA